MSCNSSTYSSSCCPEVPYPSISSESVPSLIDNLVYALYGTINKSISSGRVIWDIPCDPTTSPAEIPSIPRQAGEGLLCYIIRVFENSVAVIPNVVQTDTTQTITGLKTFTQAIAANAGVLVPAGATGFLAPRSSEVVKKAGDTMTGHLEVPGGATGPQVPRAQDVVLKNGATQAMTASLSVAGGIFGNLTGSVTGSVTGNASTATTLQNVRDIALAGAITGSTGFNGGSNITITSAIASGATAPSLTFTGTATGASGAQIPSSLIFGVTNGASAPSGYVGQLLSANTTLANIASNTVVNGATITLTAGDWEVYGNATFNFSSVSCVAGDILGAAISLTASVLPDGQRQIVLIPALTTITQSPAYSFVIPRVRINVTTSTPVYLVVQSPTTTAGTMQYASIISANRIR